MFGKKHSQSVLDNLSKIHRGKKISKYQIECIRQANIGRVKSIEERSKLSKAMLGHPNHHPHKIKYRGIFFRSSWEVICAKWLDKNGYRWKYEPERFYFKDKNFSYLPDFFVENVGYIEVKGWMWEDDKNRLDESRKSNNLILLQGLEIKQMDDDIVIQGEENDRDI
jgi:hypothetical protein